MTLCILGVALAVAGACGDGGSGREPAAQLAARSTVAPAPAAPDTTPRQPLPPLTAEERELYMDLARAGWEYLRRYYQPTTGYVNGTPDWFNTTAWDIGAQLLGTLAAKELGLVTADEYVTRTRRTLESLNRAPLFRGAAIAKLYSTRDGSIGSSRPGWSATDLGRLFVALRVVAAREPQFAELAQSIVRRHDFRQIVKDGYLHGQLIGSRGQPWTFQEGRIGYEQYMAQGFAQWGVQAANALSMRRNAQPVRVQGVEILGDRRGLDRLLSEPFILAGIELGLDGEMRDLAERVLRAQEARFRATGQVTMVSEDAVGVAPHYFYYYCVYCNRKPFVVDVSSPGRELNSPRWVSTKAAFGWHALMPSEYTQRAIEYVRPARDAQRGWASGVYEGTQRTTATYDVNTAAVLLEIAAYQLRGRRPLIQP